MTKAIALGNNFLLTAIASSFLCWLASLHPSLLLFVQALFALKFIISATAWLLDDQSSQSSESTCYSSVFG
jgi:small multidrug resistance family-3 protein